MSRACKYICFLRHILNILSNLMVVVMVSSIKPVQHVAEKERACTFIYSILS